MSESLKNSGKNGFLPKIFIKILIFLLVSACTALLLLPVQNIIHKEMSRLRDTLIEKAETALHCTIQYDSIRPGILHTFDIHGIQIRDANSRQLISIARMRISYSLWDLVFNKTRAVQSILLDRPVLNINTDADQYLIDTLKKFTGNTGTVPVKVPETDGPVIQKQIQEAITRFVPSGVVLRIRGGRCTIHSGKNTFSFSGGYCDVRSGDAMIYINARLTGNASLRQIPVTAAGVSFNITLKAGYSKESGEGDAQITIPFVSTETVQFNPVHFNVQLHSNSIYLNNTDKNPGWKITAVYNLSTDDFSAWYVCNNLSLNRIVSFEGAMKSSRSWLYLIGSGEASFSSNRQKNFQYHIDIDSSVPSNLGTGSVSIHAKGNDKKIQIGNLNILAPHVARIAAGDNSVSGQIGFNGNIVFSPLSPDGSLSIHNLALGDKELLDADFDISTRNGTIDFFCPTLVLGTVSLDAFDISLSSSQKSLGFMLSALRFRNVESYANVKLGTITIDGAVDYEPAQISASLRLDSFSAADLEDMIRPFIPDTINFLPVGGLFKNVLITTEIFFNTNFERLLYNAPRFIVAVESNNQNASNFLPIALNPAGIQNSVGLLSISGTNSRINMSDGRFIINGNLLTLNGFADYTNPMDINFSFMSNYRDLSYYLEGFYLDQRHLSIQGTHGLSVYLDSGINGSYSGFLQLDNCPFPHQNGIGNFSIYTSLRYNSDKLWSLDLQRFEYHDIDSQKGESTLQISGGADQDGIHIPTIYFSDNKGSLNGNAVFSWTAGNSVPDPAPEHFSLSGTVVLDGVNENYLASINYSGNRLTVNAHGKGIQIGRFSPDLYNATTDADIQFVWDSVDSFGADVAITAFHAKVQDRDLQFSAFGHLDNTELRLDNLKAAYSGLEGNISGTYISINEGRIHADLDVRGKAAGIPLDAQCSLDARFSPSENWLGIANAMDLLNGTLHVSKMQYADFSDTDPFDFIFSRSAGNTSVSGGPRKMLRMNTSATGDFYLSLTGPSPVRGSVIGKISNNTISASTKDLYVDLATVWRLLPPQRDLIFAGGFAEAELEISGSLSDPEFFGTIQGNSVCIQVPHYVARDIRPVPFTAVVDGNEIRLDPTPVSVGLGAGTASGWFRFDRWIPNIFKLDINVPPQTPIPFGFDITGFMANGYTSGDLTLAMENLVFSVSGDLYANNTEIGLNTDEVTKAQQNMDLYTGNAAPVVVNLNVKTGPTVEFLWPSSQIPILRLNPDMGTNVKITADSQTRQFTLNSDVKIRSGEIYYFERSFYIRSGTLTFRENELRFNPLLTVRAEARDRNDDGPVIITMFVDNAPLLSFTARFESQPSLSQNEIFALLGQNLTGSQVDEATGNIQRAFLGSSADLLAQFVVVRQAEREIRRITRLDMFSIRTQLLQNFVFSATGIKQTPVDRSAGVGNYFDNTTVFLGKYIGTDMFAQAMLALRYDEYRTTYGGLKFEWDIGIELQSPIVNIRWDFVPSHPENWWVDDNSITITYSKTF